VFGFIDLAPHGFRSLGKPFRSGDACITGASALQKLAARPIQSLHGGRWAEASIFDESSIGRVLWTGVTR
jgi:hypothetical protein